MFSGLPCQVRKAMAQEAHAPDAWRRAQCGATSAGGVRDGCPLLEVTIEARDAVVTLLLPPLRGREAASVHVGVVRTTNDECFACCL